MVPLYGGGVASSVMWHQSGPQSGISLRNIPSFYRAQVHTMVGDTIKMRVSGVVCALLVSSARAFQFKSITGKSGEVTPTPDDVGTCHSFESCPDPIRFSESCITCSALSIYSAVGMQAR